jgi:acetolactate synthase-1/2/3 large subunit
MLNENWIDKTLRWKQKWSNSNNDYKSDSNGIDLYTFIDIFNNNMDSKVTVVSDAGSAYYSISQGLRIIKNQKFVLSGAQADMGFALPASIGVSLANPKLNVCVITGDGSFNTNIQELATIRYLNLPIKLFILNNGGYLSIKNTQTKFYEGRVYGTDTKHGLWFPDFKKIAETYELSFFKYDKNDDLKNNIKMLLELDKPTIIEIVCSPDQEIVPTLMLKKDKITGKNIQCGLDDMYPFLSDTEHDEEMCK